MDGSGDIGSNGENSNTEVWISMESDEYESLSESDHFEFASREVEVDVEKTNQQPQQPRKRKYCRHTAAQTRELEFFFKDFTHPDENQRLCLSRRLGLETKQVKFWFQNRRTQMKNRLGKQENAILRQENVNLQTENSFMKKALSNPMCKKCGADAIPVKISMELQKVKYLNVQLKKKLGYLSDLSNKFVIKQIPFMYSLIRIPKTSVRLDLGIARNSMPADAKPSCTLPVHLDAGDGFMSLSSGLLATKSSSSPFGMKGNEVILKSPSMSNDDHSG